MANFGDKPWQLLSGGTVSGSHLPSNVWQYAFNLNLAYADNSGVHLLPLDFDSIDGNIVIVVHINAGNWTPYWRHTITIAFTSTRVNAPGFTPRWEGFDNGQQAMVFGGSISSVAGKLKCKVLLKKTIRIVFEM